MGKSHYTDAGKLFGSLRKLSFCTAVLTVVYLLKAFAIYSGEPEGTYEYVHNVYAAVVAEDGVIGGGGSSDIVPAQDAAPENAAGSREQTPPKDPGDAQTPVKDPAGPVRGAAAGKRPKKASQNADNNTKEMPSVSENTSAETAYAGQEETKAPTAAFANFSVPDIGETEDVRSPAGALNVHEDPAIKEDQSADEDPDVEEDPAADQDPDVEKDPAVDRDRAEEEDAGSIGEDPGSRRKDVLSEIPAAALVAAGLLMMAAGISRIIIRIIKGKEDDPEDEGR